MKKTSTHNFLSARKNVQAETLQGCAADYATDLPDKRNVYETACPLLHALGLIGGKWKLPVLWHLHTVGRCRYNRLRRSVHGVTDMMLSKCLKELEAERLVRRIQYPEVPPRVEYELTADARALIPSLNALYAWGRARLEQDGRPETVEAIRGADDPPGS